jgi:hypothetical protein
MPALQTFKYPGFERTRPGRGSKHPHAALRATRTFGQHFRVRLVHGGAHIGFAENSLIRLIIGHLSIP